jgi:uncharacterized phage protein (TIGR01671 family)
MNGRRIKFRVWKKDTANFCTDVFLWNEKLYCIDYEAEDELEGTGSDIEIAIKEVKGTEKENYIFQQFTCLTDKNGKEIWEGDIVKLDSFYKKNDIKEVEDLQSFFEMKGYNEEELGEDWRKLEIIGNIYENPELLK